MGKALTNRILSACGEIRKTVDRLHAITKRSQTHASHPLSPVGGIGNLDNVVYALKRLEQMVCSDVVMMYTSE